MVQRVTVSPSEVRGYGDIISPKTTEDFYEYRSVLTETDGVYTLSYETKGVSLSVDSESVEYGESVVLTALVRDEGLPASGETVTFYQGETLIYTGTTGDDGTVSYTVTGLAVGGYNFTAKYDIYTSNVVNVSVTKIDTSFTVNVNPTTFLHGQDVTISGVVNGVGSGANVLITSYPHSEIVASLTTETGGAFSTTVSNIPVGATRLYFSYVGDAYHEDALEIIDITVIDDTNCIELGVTGSSFSTYSNAPFIYTGKVWVDWGDNTGFVEYTGGKLSHTYASSGNWTVKVYGNVTGLKSMCFTWCIGLTSITLPNTIISIGGDCFDSCTGLTEIVLEWTVFNDIPLYNSAWITGCTNFDHFLIPQGTKSLYTAKNYPSALLKEDGEPTPASLDLSLTAGKQILSYADVSSGNEYATLTATVLDENDDPVEGATVELYKDNVLWDTLTTSSAGTVSKTYTSIGAGDVSFKAECGSLVTETFVITDIFYYDGLTVDKQRYTTVSGSPVLTYSNNGLNVNTNVATVGLVRNNFLTLPSDYEAEITLTYAPQSSYCGGICFDDWLYDWGTANLNGASTFKLSNTQSLHSNLRKPVTDDVVKIIKTGTTIKAYINDNLIVTDTISNDNHYLQFRTYQNRSTTFKDLKIRQL